MAKICVVGSWHQASVSSACLADIGHKVWGVHGDKESIRGLSAGKAPIHEPKLNGIIKKNLKAGRLRYSTSYSEVLPQTDFVNIALDTTVREDDSPDLGTFWNAIEEVARASSKPFTLVINSQVPVGTCEDVISFFERKRPRVRVDVAYNPEFLRLGSAVDLYRKPDRIVVGALDPAVVRRVSKLFQKLNRPIVATDLRTAEMIKHASNSFLATSISFINEIAGICDALGADIRVVAEAMRLDQRIGSRAYLNPGLGFGGGTLGRDLRALQGLGEASGRATALVNAVLDVNERQQSWAFEQLKALLGGLKGRKIGVLGLTYKAGTDTLRRSLALEIIAKLKAAGAVVTAFDKLVQPQELAQYSDIRFSNDAFEAVEGCDALVLLSGGAEVKSWNLDRLGSLVSQKIILDCNHAIDPDSILLHGFVYAAPGQGVRRPKAHAARAKRG